MQTIGGHYTMAGIHREESITNEMSLTTKTASLLGCCYFKVNDCTGQKGERS